jgi:arylsulfatase A-like enzyme/Tfp pilus assembly protein PilF
MAARFSHKVFAAQADKDVSPVWRAVRAPGMGREYARAAAGRGSCILAGVRLPATGPVEKRGGTGALLGVLLSIVCAFSPESAPASPAAARPGVILITVDTLRADRLGCYGYAGAASPNIDALAAEGVRFRTCVAQAPLTLPSHCSILTGLQPTVHGVRDNVGYRLDASHETLAEILKGAGYRTAAFVGSYVLNAKFGLSQGFDRYGDVPIRDSPGGIINLNQLERRAAEVIDLGIAWLAAHRGPPFFLWIHLFDPHDPYAPPPPFDSRFKERPYDGEIAYVDREVGRLLAFLKESGLASRTLVVLVGDHGESFGEHQEYTHGYFIYDTTLLVPLIVRPPGGRPARSVVTGQVSTVDIAPTILELLGMPRAAELQGRSLAGIMLGRAPDTSQEAYSETHYPAQFGWSPLRSVRRPDAKFIDAPRAELYDLAGDPGELRNLHAQRPKLVQELQGALARIDAAALRPGLTSSAVSLSREERDRLAALGYVSPGTPTQTAGRSPAKLADPKDKLPLFKMVSEAGQAAAKGQCALAIPLLERVLAREPSLPAANLLLGRCLYEAERFGPARSAFTRFLGSDPDNLEGLFFAAACDFYQDRLNSAEAGLKKVLTRDPDYLPARKYLGFVHQATGQIELAIEAFQKASQTSPGDEESHAKLGFLLAGQSRFAEAVAHFETAVKINPENAATRYNLGATYLKTNRKALADRELAEACRLDKKYCGGGRPGP